MSLPTNEQQTALVQSIVDHASAQSMSLLGITFDVSTLRTAIEVAVAAACMKQWQLAHAAGKAKADAITTEGDAEAAQRNR
jgi:hypothetical protein